MGECEKDSHKTQECAHTGTYTRAAPLIRLENWALCLSSVVGETEAQRGTAVGSRGRSQWHGAGGVVHLLRKTEVTLSVPFPIPPAPGDTLAPCKAIPTLGRAAIAIPMRCSASPVSPAGWAPSVLVSPAKGLLHPP